jgi:hypothetical protein
MYSRTNRHCLTEALLVVGYDDRSRAIWQFRSDLSMPEHMRRRPTTMEVSAYKIAQAASTQ